MEALDEYTAFWLLQPSDDAATQAGFLMAFYEQLPELEPVVDHFRRFAVIVRDRQADRLDEWMQAALASECAALKRFANSLQRDEEAVRMACQLDWSNGQTEGQVNRLKLIKRQMYGRARFDLLRLRVLHPP